MLVTTGDLLTALTLYLLSIMQGVEEHYMYTNNENREWKFWTLMPIFLDAAAFHFPTLSGLQRRNTINFQGNIVYLTQWNLILDSPLVVHLQVRGKELL